MPEQSSGMTKIDQLVSGYLNGEDMLDPSRTITFLHHAELLRDPFAPADVEHAQSVVRIWKPSWLKGIDWDEETCS